MKIKNAVQYGLVLLLTAGFGQVCHAQSKEETLQWIKLRLPYAAATRGELEDDIDTLAYHDVVANGCSLTFVERRVINNAGQHAVVETTITVPLGRLSVVDSVKGSDGEWAQGNSVELKAFDKIITTKWTLQKSKHGSATGTTSGSDTLKEYDIVTSDADLARRLAKAFAHANELCGARKEAF